MHTTGFDPLNGYMATRLASHPRQGGGPSRHYRRRPRQARRSFIEKVGTYNLNTNPATIDVIHDRALYWLQVGAEMSHTARAILGKGVVYDNHLLNGVKSALTEEEANKKPEAPTPR